MIDRKYEKNRENQINSVFSDLIPGRNAIIEALKSERPLNKIFLQKPVSDATLRNIEALAKSRAVPVVYVEKAWLDKAAGGTHQGAAASAAVKEYCDISDMLAYADEKGETPLIIVANRIYDANNLGALIRNAEAAGAHGVVIPKRNAAGLTGAVARVSAGAIEYMRVARTANVAETLRVLKKQGLWVIGADSAGKINYTECDMTGGTAVVIGGESEGLGRLVAETCDYIVSLPMRGRVTSLNASAAAAVMLYEALRQRAASVTADNTGNNK